MPDSRYLMLDIQIHYVFLLSILYYNFADLRRCVTILLKMSKKGDCFTSLAMSVNHLMSLRDVPNRLRGQPKQSPWIVFPKKRIIFGNYLDLSLKKSILKYDWKNGHQASSVQYPESFLEYTLLRALIVIR